MPNLDAANIAYNLLKMTGGGGITIGPILLGCAQIGSHRHAVGHRAPARQHDGACERRTLSARVEQARCEE